MYEEHFCERYYSFEHKGWQFIVLDVIMYGDGRENRYYGQIDWMKIMFDSIGAEKPVFVTLHVPVLSDGKLKKKVLLLVLL